MSESAIVNVRVRLVAYKGRYPEICAKTGLSYSWLSKFSRAERGTRPSFDVISKLLSALDELELQAEPNSDAVPSPSQRA